MGFRDEEGQDVLLFVDNIFRFTQAGSEVSALLGRIPSAVGYQPTLATDLAMLQERITTPQKGSITSVQAVYVPADDLTDPVQPQPSRTWTPPRCCLVRSLSLAPIPQWIPWIPRRACWTRPSWDRGTTTLPAARRRSFRTTSPCRTLLRSWVWTS